MKTTPILDNFIEIYKDTSFCIGFTDSHIKSLKDGDSNIIALSETFKTLSDNAQKAYQIVCLVENEIWDACSPENLRSFTQALKIKLNAQRLNMVDNTKYHFFAPGEYWSETLTELKESCQITQSDEDSIRKHISTCSKWLNIAIDKLTSILNSYSGEISDSSMMQNDENNLIPEEWTTESAKAVFQKAIDGGLLDKEYQPTSKCNTMALQALLAECIYDDGQIQGDKWKPFERLWNVTNLRNTRSKSKNRVGTVKGQDVIFQVFGTKTTLH